MNGFSTGARLAIVIGFTGLSAVFWTWAFAQCSGFFRRMGTPEDMFPFWLLAPSFSVAYFGAGLVGTVAATLKRSRYAVVFLVLHNWLYPCTAVGLSCVSMGSTDFSMGNHH